MNKKKIGGVVVGLVGVVGILKGFVLAPSAPAAAAGGPTTTTTVPPGPIVTLEPITINIGDGRFLKVGLALQLPHDHKEGAGHGAKDSDDPTKGYARALDLTIEILGAHAFDELVSTEGRRAAKEELGHALEEAYHGDVEGVYFHQFVMQ